MLPNRAPESLCHELPIKLVGCSSETLRNDMSRPWRNVPVRSEPTGRAVGFTSRALGPKRPPQEVCRPGQAAPATGLLADHC